MQHAHLHAATSTLKSGTSQAMTVLADRVHVHASRKTASGEDGKSSGGRQLTLMGSLAGAARAGDAAGSQSMLGLGPAQAAPPPGEKLAPCAFCFTSPIQLPWLAAGVAASKVRMNSRSDEGHDEQTLHDGLS